MSSSAWDELAELDAAFARGVADVEGVDLTVTKPAMHMPPASIATAGTAGMSAFGPSPGAYRMAWDDGSKFAGGFGTTQILQTDYWTLRARSAQLFETNHYARGFIRRLVTNEINTGLHLEAMPEERLLGYDDDGLADWAETVENRFRIWGRSARVCDHRQQLTFGAIQALARMEALVAGDVLVVIQQDPLRRVPRVQLIGSSAVQTPLGKKPRKGHRIEHGVELDGRDRQVAYWIRQRDGKARRLPAYGERSGRRIAWLMYGVEMRLNATRGKPILSLLLQSLREIDRYRDSTQRKATLGAAIALYLKRKETDSPAFNSLRRMVSAEGPSRRPRSTNRPRGRSTRRSSSQD